ncbi:VOC family protein [Microbulbifer sp. THAF38]|uniref:VOC family protein n=1 Tax=Microbulbifer sp. THAF38 TaxID=2587856 RepID=UPI0012695336|nr:VOC family protein [Microbulbifer sp. THAF38]QFT55428.1 Glyoxalase-like domain protein [Microbulbifer sp. THAF38]
MNLNQVTLPVSNMDEATHFYREMGFVQIVDTPHYARFECPDGDATFSLTLSSNSTENSAVVYFEHEKLDSWVRELKRKGFIFSEDPKDQPYLWREAVLFDPSGNKLKLYWAGANRKNPPWRVERRL